MIKKAKNNDQVSSLKEIFEKYLPQQQLKKIIIDIKPLEQKRVIEALKKSFSKKIYNKYAKKVIFIGKSIPILQEIKKNFPNSFTALEGDWGSEPVVQYDKYLNKKTHDFVSLNAELMFGHTKIKKHFFGQKRRNKKYLENYFLATKNKNIKTIAWTINNKKNYHYLLSKEVEIILTDLSLLIHKRQ